MLPTKAYILIKKSVKQHYAFFSFSMQKLQRFRSRGPLIFFLIKGKSKNIFFPFECFEVWFHPINPYGFSLSCIFYNSFYKIFTNLANIVKFLTIYRERSNQSCQIGKITCTFFTNKLFWGNCNFLIIAMW